MLREWFENPNAIRGRIVGFAFASLWLLAVPGRPSPIGTKKEQDAYLDALAADRQGSAIVMDPSTGEILAAWHLQAAVENAYPPGSTAKIVEATAALEDGVLAPRSQIVCRRVPPLLGSAYRCVHPPAPEGFTVVSALANSCNYFFAAVSIRLTSDSLLHWYSVFGFGAAPTLNGEPVFSRRVRLGPGERSKALAALGEQDVVATPAQLLEAYCLVANRGVAWGLWRDRPPPRTADPLRRITVRPATYSTLIQGLVDCVRFGTCQAASVPGVQVAGKTGTATALDGSGATHAWFVGFAPVERPKIALVIFLERGTGAADAAPLAGKLFRHYLAARGD